MKLTFEKVIDGLLKYIDSEIYPGMNDWQEVAARIIIGRMVSNVDDLKEKIMSNGFLRTLNIVDTSGMVDVDSLADDIKCVLTQKEKFSFTIPMIGKYTFKPADIDVLYRTIISEE